MPPVKAAICHEFGTDLTLETIELRAPVKGEIEVTLGAVAICHSDISYIDGAWGGTLPAVYGHEGGHCFGFGGWHIRLCHWRSCCRNADPSLRALWELQHRGAHSLRNPL